AAPHPRRADALAPSARASLERNVTNPGFAYPGSESTFGDVLFWIRASGLRRERVSAWGWGPTRIQEESVSSLLLADDVELRGVGDGHHRHHARLDRIGHDAVGGVGPAAGHV